MPRVASSSKRKQSTHRMSAYLLSRDTVTLEPFLASRLASHEWWEALSAEGGGWWVADWPRYPSSSRRILLLAGMFSYQQQLYWHPAPAPKGWKDLGSVFFDLALTATNVQYISQTKRIRNKLFRKQLFTEDYRGIEEVPVFLFLLLSSTHTDIHDVGADMRVSTDMPVHLVNALWKHQLLYYSGSKYFHFHDIFDIPYYYICVFSIKRFKPTCGNTNQHIIIVINEVKSLHKFLNQPAALRPVYSEDNNYTVLENEACCKARYALRKKQVWQRG